MIVKGGSRWNARYFCKHLANAKENEQVLLLEIRGMLGAETMEDAFVEMKAIAKATLCKNYFYHASLNPRDTEHLSRDRQVEAVSILGRHLGLEHQPCFVVEHVKEGRAHLHVVWSRIDGDSLTAISDAHNYAKHEAAAREIEQTFDLAPVASVLGKDRARPRPERRPKDFEGYRAARTGLEIAQVKEDALAAWTESATGLEMNASLRRRGYILCRGDRRDFCIVDPAGDEHSLGRRLAGVKAAELRAKMQDVDRPALPSVAEARALADAWEEEGEAARKVRHRQLARQVKEMTASLRMPISAFPIRLEGKRSLVEDRQMRQALRRIGASLAPVCLRPLTKEEEQIVIQRERARRAALRKENEKPIPPAPPSWTDRIAWEHKRGEKEADKG